MRGATSLSSHPWRFGILFLLVYAVCAVAEELVFEKRKRQHNEAVKSTNARGAGEGGGGGSRVEGGGDGMVVLPAGSSSYRGSRRHRGAD